MIDQIENIKQTVKRHTIIPFAAADVKCERLNNTNVIYIKDRYVMSKNKEIMDTLGIRSNLTKDIFSKPDENWNYIQAAISSIDKKKQFSGIVNDNNQMLTLNSKAVQEETQLNYDSRIDSLIDAIMSNSTHNLQTINFNNQTCQVEVNAALLDQVDCGLGDLWNFGTSTTVGALNQQFKQFFNRLICTNGMTTSQGIAYRNSNNNTNIGKQFLKYSSSREAISAIKPRVDRLRNCRASLYEVKLIADSLSKEDKSTFFPQYANMRQEFAERGYNIEKLNSKQTRFMYTDENLYDVFNLATNLASHQREVIGVKASAELNKAAGDMFVKGPALEYKLVDIYAKN